MSPPANGAQGASVAWGARGRRLLLILAVVPAAVLALALLGTYLLRPITERLLGQALATKVSIDGLALDVPQRSIVVSRLVLGDPAAQLSVARAAATIDLRSLMRGHIVADAVTVAGVAATIDVDRTYRVSVTGLPAPRGAEEGTSHTADASIRDVTIRHLVVTNATLTIRHAIQGQPRTVPVRIDELKADDTSLRIDGSRVHLAADLRGEADGVPLTGRIGVTPDGPTQTVDIRADIGKVALPLPLVDLPPALSGLTGTLSGSLTYRSNPRGKEDWVQVDLGLDRPHLSGRADTWMGARTAHVEGLRVDLVTGSLDLGKLTFEGPSVGVALRPDGLVLPLEMRQSATAGPPWKVTGGVMNARGGSVTILRGEQRYTTTIGSARWEGIASGRMGSIALDGHPEEGGTIAVSGTIGIEPVEVGVAVTAEGVALAPAAAVLPELPLPIARGTASGRATLNGPLHALRMHGQLRLDQVHTAPPDRARPDQVLACDTVDAEISVDPERRAIEIASLQLHYPYAMVQRSLEGIFPYSAFASGTAAPGATRENPLAVRIKKLEIVGGRTDFVDRIVAPNYWTALADVNAAAEGVVLQGSEVRSFRVVARQDEINPVEATGNADGDGWHVAADLETVFLPTLNAYLAPLLGYKAEAGLLSLEVRGRLAKEAFRTNNHVTLRSVSLLQTGLDIVQRSTGVPLPIALAMLADHSGTVELAVPLRGDLTTRRFELGSLVGQAVSKAIVGALSTPLKFLGMLFGTKGSPRALAIDPIPFAVGSGVLDASGESRVTQIARILAAHTELTLVAKPEVSAEDLAIVGGDGLQELAAARATAVTKALVGGPIQTPARQLVMVGWKREPEGALSERSGVYVEMQLSADYNR